MEFNLDDLKLELSAHSGEIYEQIKQENLFANPTSEAVILDLDRLYSLWEVQIEKENKKKFITDDVSNALAIFSKRVVAILFPEVHHILDEDELTMKKLYSHRHFGYAFFAELDTNVKSLDIDNDQRRINYQRLYDSLVQYYTLFYGRFHNNVEAIELLCKYYINDVFKKMPREKEATEKLVYALRRHIGRAGDSGDYGYAFQGLSRVREYVENLDSEIILLLLNKFTPVEIRNNVITRKQIWNIIEYSHFKNKKQLKFYFLDAVQLEEYATRLLFTHKLKHQQSFFYNSWTDEDHTQNHVICKEENPEKILGVIQRKPYRLRLIKYSDSVFAKFCYEVEREQTGPKLESKVPYIEINGYSLEKEYTYDYDDYELNSISYDLYIKLDQQLSEEKGPSTPELVLSYLWVDGYKGLKEIELSLDGVFHHTEGQIIQRQDNTPLPKNFFHPMSHLYLR